MEGKREHGGICGTCKCLECFERYRGNKGDPDYMHLLVNELEKLNEILQKMLGLHNKGGSGGTGYCL
jgi:hypothetical protein